MIKSENENIEKRKTNKTTFFNSVTNEPIVNTLNHDDKNYYITDSEYELKNKNEILHDDILGHNEKEIKFYDLWNNYRDSYPRIFVNEKKTLDKLEKFVENFIDEKMEEIKENKLINELIGFLMFLVDIGNVSISFFNYITLEKIYANN